MKKTLISAALLSVIGMANAAGNIEAGKLAVDKFNCASCHGKDYKTPLVPEYPKLAGQHADYLAHALKAYKAGGKAANGRSHAIMEAQVKELTSADIKNIAAYLASLPTDLVLKK